MLELKGFTAYWMNQKLSENPYNRDLEGDSWFSWRTGWYNAHQVKNGRFGKYNQIKTSFPKFDS